MLYNKSDIVLNAVVAGVDALCAILWFIAASTAASTPWLVIDIVCGFCWTAATIIWIWNLTLIVNDYRLWHRKQRK